MEGFFTICLIAACPSAAPWRRGGSWAPLQTARPHLQTSEASVFLCKNGYGRRRMAAYMPRDCDAAVIRLRSLSGSRRRSGRAGICGKRVCAFLSAGGCAEKSKIFDSAHITDDGLCGLYG